MRRSTLAICALLMVATSGCDQVDAAKAKRKLAWDKLRGRSTQSPPPGPVRPATDTAATRVASEQEQARAQRPRPPAAPPGQEFSRDVPYRSADTGTVNPGMSEREVYELWAAPLAVRRVGQYTYLFFRNSCEYTCGTMRSEEHTSELQSLRHLV